MPDETNPPPFLALVAHPLRWQLLTALAPGDHRVRELVERTGEPQNLVSYHLALLRRGGLVTSRRSSFDGRDSYYRLDLVACARALSDTGGALHPALRLEAAVSPRPPRFRRRPARVLFLCTGNSSRSPMAAALLRARAGERVEAFSAGSHPKPLNPRASRALGKYGIDLSNHQPRPLTAFVDRKLDYVISLCDKVREVLPPFSRDPQLVHWSIPNPDDVGDDAAFRGTAAELDTRIRFLLPGLAPAGN
jgi:ArsR family transcriptional regulator, arsenate/arsenite/antimonite-responsive transcriptional repressor / arsenate reductase (thioredoxin)